jgi:hypothetical protein
MIQDEPKPGAPRTFAEALKAMVERYHVADLVLFVAPDVDAKVTPEVRTAAAELGMPIVRHGMLEPGGGMLVPRPGAIPRSARPLSLEEGLAAIAALFEPAFTSPEGAEA